jgi:cyclase
MLMKRLIPVVLLRNGLAVQSKGFKRYQILGNPTTIVERLSSWCSDELIYLDISRDAVYDLRRDDLNCQNRGSLRDILSDVAKRCFMPLTFGGGIRTLEQIYERLTYGADKVTLNTQLFSDPSLLTEAARRFGSQCIVASIDYRTDGTGAASVWVDGGRIDTGMDPVAMAVRAQELGAGEVLLNAIDRDGAGQGYDLATITAVVSRVTIPVIAMGGVGSWEHLADGLRAGASAVAAANIFSYTENSVYNAKSYLYENSFPVRRPAPLTDQADLGAVALGI